MNYILETIWNCFGYTSIEPLRENDEIENPVKLSQHKAGISAVIVKNGKRLCGSGACMGNTEIVQDKSYFEAKLQSCGMWGVGVALESEMLDITPLGESVHSWVIRQDAHVCHNKKTVHHPQGVSIQEGDVIGCSYDHVELNFFHNGKPLNVPLRGIKGTIYPVFYVDDSAILDVSFDNFLYPPPTGYQKLMMEKSII